MIACIVVSCKGDDSVIPIKLGNNAGNCDKVLDDYTLDAESKINSAYHTSSVVTYFNEAGAEKSYSINNERPQIEDFVFTENDTIKYCYRIESVTTKLLSDDGLEYTLVSESKPYFANLQSMQEANVLKVFYEDTKNDTINRRLVFRKILHINTYPPPLYETTTLLDSQYFIDMEFKSVEFTKFNSPIIKVFYNDKIGVVAYEDEAGILWQFKEKY